MFFPLFNESRIIFGRADMHPNESKSLAESSVPRILPKARGPKGAGRSEVRGGDGRREGWEAASAVTGDERRGLDLQCRL